MAEGKTASVAKERYAQSRGALRGIGKGCRRAAQGACAPNCRPAGPATKAARAGWVRTPGEWGSVMQASTSPEAGAS
jgi:hypothetical protein